MKTEKDVIKWFSTYTLPSNEMFELFEYLKGYNISIVDIKSHHHTSKVSIDQFKKWFTNTEEDKIDWSQRAHEIQIAMISHTNMDMDRIIISVEDLIEQQKKLT